MPQAKKLMEVGGAFLRLGLVSFGGPTSHLGYFRREFVERRGWLSDAAYADLVALCQFLPGPASSQVAFGLGMGRAGPAGGILASVAFMLPSAAAMILFAYGVASMGGVASAGWLHGLRLAAVAVVALAVWGMAGRLCPDWPRRLLALAACAAALLWPGAAVQGLVIAAAAALGLLAWRSASLPAAAPARTRGPAYAWAAAAMILFALLLALLPAAAAATGSRRLAVFAGFYRAGALVFGGGHVVLPLLRAGVVAPGWVGDREFLAGYGAVQAVPGPIFTFAGYLGTLIEPAPRAWAGGLLALLAIFLPGWLLVAGAFPFWHSLRGRPWAQGALRGANAAVVGILLAALWRPLCTESVQGVRDAAGAAAALALLGPLRTPPWAVVALMAAAGQWVLG